MELVPHYIWNMPSRLTGKDVWQTREKLTAEQALTTNPDAWPVYRSLEMRPTTKRVAVADGACHAVA